MSKKISINIMSNKSIQNAVKEVENYAYSLTDKCNELVKKLLEIGVKTAEMKIKDSPLGKYVSVSTDISAEEMGTKGVLISIGEIKKSEGFAPFSTLLAIEFGAGIHYNPIPNPNADKLGYGVGTFPGQLHAFQDDGWMYWDEDEQKWKHSYGVKATMPMYNASIEMMERLVTVAKEVFG